MNINDQIIGEINGAQIGLVLSLVLPSDGKKEKGRERLNEAIGLAVKASAKLADLMAQDVEEIA